MPTSLPDHTTTGHQPAGVTRRAFLRLLAPLTAQTPAQPARGAPARFTALSPDVALWLRCWRSVGLSPG